MDFFDKLARRADSYRVTVGPLGGAASGALGSRRWGRTLTVTALVVIVVVVVVACVVRVVYCKCCLLFRLDVRVVVFVHSD